jgi:hypothetical protein
VPGKKKRLQYSYLPPIRKAISDHASAGETPTTPTNAFAAESGLPTTFSVRTGVIRAQGGSQEPFTSFKDNEAVPDTYLTSSGLGFGLALAHGDKYNEKCGRTIGTGKQFRLKN